MSDDVNKELCKQNISVAGGCTSKNQPLDVCLNKPFNWHEYMQQAVAQQQSGDRIKTPTKQDIVDWVVLSNKELGFNPAMVKKSFLVYGNLMVHKIH
jgi:hypothetical protein